MDHRTAGLIIAMLSFTLVFGIVFAATPSIDKFFPLTDPAIKEGSSQMFNITASDADGDALTTKWMVDGIEQYGKIYSNTSDVNRPWLADSTAWRNSMTDAAAGDGVIHLVWKKQSEVIGAGISNTSIMYARSANGVSWKITELVVVDSPSTINSGPAIAVDKDSPGSVYLVWAEKEGPIINNYNLPVSYSLKLISSSDAGQSWSKPSTVVDGSDMIDEPKISANMNIHVAWVDERDGNKEIYYKKGMDRGESWGVDTRLTNNLGRSSDPAIYADAGSVHVLWINMDDNNAPNSAEIYHRKWNISGWQNTQQLTNDALQSRKPRVSASGNDIRVIWGSLSGSSWSLVYKSSADDGETWDDQRELSSTLTNPSYSSISGSEVLWSDVRDGNSEIYHSNLNSGIVKRVTNTAPTSSWPVIASDDKAGMSHIAWMENNEVYYSTPSGLNFFNYVSTYTSSGDHDVTAVVDDGSSSASKSWKLTVDDVNAPVEIINTPPEVAVVGRRYVYEADGRDPDGGSITCNVSDKRFTQNGCAFNWTPSKTELGELLVSFNATDGKSTDTKKVKLYVVKNLQDVVDAASAGSTISLRGNYSGATLGKQITLDCTASLIYETLIVKADGVKIKNCTFIKKDLNLSSEAIAAVWVEANGVSIVNNTISGIPKTTSDIYSAGRAILVACGKSGAVIESNKLFMNAMSIYACGDDHIIKNNNISDNEIGILMTNAAVTSNHIHNNALDIVAVWKDSNITGNDINGVILLDTGAGSSVVGYNNISNGQIFINGCGGASDAVCLLKDNSTIIGNRLRNASIEMKNTIGNKIYDNVIYNGGIELLQRKPAGSAENLTSKDNEIKNNVLNISSGSKGAVHLDKDTMNTLLLNNSFYNVSSYCVYGFLSTFIDINNSFSCDRGGLINLGLLIDNSSDVSKGFSGNRQATLILRTSQGNQTLVEFNYDFNLGSITTLKDELSLATINLNEIDDKVGFLLARYLKLQEGKTKTFYITKNVQSSNRVCIRDEDIPSIDYVTANCTGTGETIVTCDGTSQFNYVCTDTPGGTYKITGLKHSAVKEIAPILYGDTNGDCKVNIFDLAAVGVCFGKQPQGSCINGDVNADGSINIFDLAAVGINFGGTC